MAEAAHRSARPGSPDERSRGTVDAPRVFRPVAIPALALSGSNHYAVSEDGVAPDALPIHLSAAAAAALEAMLGGRHGHVGTGHLTALRAMPAAGRRDADLAELMEAAGRDGGVYVTFL
jgi:hypothetical protein